nr:MerR family transcriptional regulator [Naumannella cuiyingiana]
MPGLEIDAPEQAQELLFDGDFSPVADDIGYRGPVACSAAGITYRQLDYWARTGLVKPGVRGASGSGSQRLYSFRDILLLRVIKRLLDAGIALQQIRVAIDHLRARGVEDLSQVTLMSDGISVYECTEDHEIRDLLAGGQGMFAIGLGSVWKDVRGSLHELPAERAAAEEESEEPMVAFEGDELAKRRAAKRRAAG